jgi:hypothetical protein
VIADSEGDVARNCCDIARKSAAPLAERGKGMSEKILGDVVSKPGSADRASR